jgi:hypothetical protein
LRRCFGSPKRSIHPLTGYCGRDGVGDPAHREQLLTGLKRDLDALGTEDLALVSSLVRSLRKPGPPT